MQPMPAAVRDCSRQAHRACRDNTGSTPGRSGPPVLDQDRPWVDPGSTGDRRELVPRIRPRSIRSIGGRPAIKSGSTDPASMPGWAIDPGSTCRPAVAASLSGRRAVDPGSSSGAPASAGGRCGVDAWSIYRGSSLGSSQCRGDSGSTGWRHGRSSQGNFQLPSFVVITWTFP